MISSWIRSPGRNLAGFFMPDQRCALTAVRVFARSLRPSRTSRSRPHSSPVNIIRRSKPRSLRELSSFLGTVDSRLQILLRPYVGEVQEERSSAAPDAAGYVHVFL
jgi:hypothetical protein